MQACEVIRIINKIAGRINGERMFLTELDNVIGDGDHGINMARGFEAVKKKLESTAFNTPANVFITVGMTLVSTVGGAAGPLYGTAFMNMGKALNGKENIDINDFCTALKSAADGVSMRGKSTVGEKTMLDAMVPAWQAIKEAIENGDNASKALSLGVEAAYKGVEYTKTIVATKGRASYLGERSIGHQDPGATSFTFMLEELKKAV